jgi:hypothetical protein
MSFCRILSTLCSQVIFHNIPHFGKRAGQKVQRKIAVAVQNVKPLFFLSRSFALSHTNLLRYSICFFIIKLTKEPRRRVWSGRIRDGEIGDGEIVDCRGRVFRDFSLFKPYLINMNVHSATCSCSVELYKLWYTLVDFLPNWNFRGIFSIY